MCHPQAAPHERWHHQAATSAVCCEEEGRKTQKSRGQQLHALTSLRLLLEVLIREELEFLTDSMYQLRLGACRRKEARLTSTYVKPEQYDAVSVERKFTLKQLKKKKTIDIAPSISGCIVFGGVFFCCCR